MKKILYLSVFIILFSCCGTNSNNGQGNNGEQNNVSIQSTSLPGFNVNNFANLVRKTTNPSQIENEINQDGNDVNNLDLDKDGKVDFLKVTESENKIQVTDDVDQNNSVNVATLTISKNQTDNNTAEMHIQGNPSYCGQDYQYHSHISVGEVLLLAYLFSPHRYYVPVYHYGYYPPYYRGYATSSTRTVTRTYTTTRTLGGNNTSTVRPTAPSRSSLSNPTHSQRSFSTRDNSTPVRSGGFGKSSSSGSSFGSGRSSFGSGRSSFGGGKSSFGRRR